VDFINLAQGRERLHVFVNTAMNVMHFWANDLTLAFPLVSDERLHSFRTHFIY